MFNKEKQIRQSWHLKGERKKQKLCRTVGNFLLVLLYVSTSRFVQSLFYLLTNIFSRCCLRVFFLLCLPSSIVGFDSLSYLVNSHSNCFNFELFNFNLVKCMDFINEDLRRKMVRCVDELVQTNRFSLHQTSIHANTHIIWGSKFLQCSGVNLIFHVFFLSFIHSFIQRSINLINANGRLLTFTPALIQVEAQLIRQRSTIQVCRFIAFY